MKISSRKDGDVQILALSGKLTIGVGDTQLRQAVHDCLEMGATKILLDLSGVTTIDSSGVGELVSTFTMSANRGARVKLEKLPPKIRDVLTITQLITVFEIYDDEAEALESFA